MPIALISEWSCPNQPLDIFATRAILNAMIVNVFTTIRRLRRRRTQIESGSWCVHGG
jgi:hypothetical protein